MTQRTPPPHGRPPADPSALGGLSASLLDAERAIPPAPSGALERVLSRVEATIAAPPVAAAATHGALWIKVAVAALVVSGAVGIFVATRDDAAAPASVASVAAPSSSTAIAPSPATPPPPSPGVLPATPPALPAPSDLRPAPTAPANPIVEETGTVTEATALNAAPNKDVAIPNPTIVQETETIPPATAPSGTEPTHPVRPSADPVAERALLDQAQAALRAKRLPDLFAAVNLHAERFPRGALTEEREALRIRGLVEAGDRDAAKARADRFRRRYPQSLYASSLDALGL